MPRFFNTTGPCNPADHYMLPPEGRIHAVAQLLERKAYFVLHAARQTGKSTAMRAYAAMLRERGTIAVYASLESARWMEEVANAEPLWVRAVENAAWAVLPLDVLPSALAASVEPTGGRLAGLLAEWASRVAPRPVIVFLDEADTIIGPAMVNLLSQLRSGFTDRPARFPSSIALIGMRDLRDYITPSKDGVPANPGSPFNIKAASLTLADFTREQVEDLYVQHSAETQQVWTKEAIDRAFDLSQGQPFLCNALADRCVTDLVPDRSIPITAEHVERAREQLIEARTTHLDNLSERLKDPRVAKILQEVLLGDFPERIDTTGDDFQYCVDLGLVRLGRNGVEVSNPIYREVLTRLLTKRRQDALPQPLWKWQGPDGGLDLPALIAAFLPWWRENAEAFADSESPYPEALPHLCFMAFLQKVVNGGGRVEREFGAGRGRIDLLVHFGADRFVIELKRVPPRHRSLERAKTDGIAQLSAYLDTLGLMEGWLLIFDQREGRTWEERLWTEELVDGGKRLHLIGA